MQVFSKRNDQTAYEMTYRMGPWTFNVKITKEAYMALRAKAEAEIESYFENVQPLPVAEAAPAPTLTGAQAEALAIPPAVPDEASGSEEVGPSSESEWAG